MQNGDPKIWLAKPGNSPFWVIRYEDTETGRTQQKSTGTAKKKEAERILSEFRADLLNGRHRGSTNGTWEAFRRKYESEVLSGLAQKTVKKADVVLDAVERLLKPKKLSDLTASQISRFIAELRDGKRSESTIAGYLAHLRAALSWAVGVGLLPVVPKIKKPKRAKVQKKSKGRAPTEKEFEKILATVPEVVGEHRTASWRHLIEGLWWSGLRLGESLEVWWDRDDKLRIDLTEGRPLLRIPAELEKGHQDRLLPIAPEFAEFLLKTPPGADGPRIQADVGTAARGEADDEPGHEANRRRRGEGGRRRPRRGQVGEEEVRLGPRLPEGLRGPLGPSRHAAGADADDAS
jgi:integrase